MVTRERKCDNPVPQNGGKPCDPKGATETRTDCNQPCDSETNFHFLPIGNLKKIYMLLFYSTEKAYYQDK